MKKRTKDIDDAIFRLRSLNATIGILASVTNEGTENVVYDRETIADALYSVNHSVDTIISDLEEVCEDALIIRVAPKTAQKLGCILDEERKRGNTDIGYTDYASMLLEDAIGWKYAEMDEEADELSDEELDALGIPVVCIAK